MEGERRHNDLVTLKEYFEVKLGAMDKALSLAERSMEKRLEGTFVTRKEFDLIVSNILKDHRANIALFLSALAVCVGVISVFIKVKG